MRWLLGVMGGAAVLGALIALALPLSLHAVDRGGQPISCGSGFRPTDDNAAHEDAVNQDQHDNAGAFFQITHYTAQCDALVATRRHAAIAVTICGGLLVGIAALLTLRTTGYGLRAPVFADFGRHASTPLFPHGSYG